MTRRSSSLCGRSPDEAWRGRQFAAGVFFVLLLLSTGLLSAAPRILYHAFSFPAQAHVGDPILLIADGLVAPVRVFFSNGATPAIEATPVLIDANRGAILVHVPAGTVTGNMKVSAAGIDSPLYYFRVLPGTFTQGTDVVTGQATNGATPVANVLALLLRDTGCSLPAVQDFALTDGTGHYTMHGVDGSYFIYAFPPAASGLSSSPSTASLTSSPTTLNLALTAGTSVTGRVVDATTPSVGVAGARLSLNGPSTEMMSADTSGNFSGRLLAGTWSIQVQPPAGNAHAFTKVSVVVSGTNQSLGNIPLDAGVHVSGVLTRQADGTPLAGAEIDAYGADFCCGKQDKKFSAGDGSYDLYVPQNTTIEPFVVFDDDVIFADVDGGNHAIGTSSVVINLSALDAAFITGAATDLTSLNGIRGLQIVASSGGRAAAFAFACADGSYRMRVVPNASGYILSTGATDSGPAYAMQTWNNTTSGTYFGCEGVPIPAPTTGGTTTGINFKVPRAASVQGLISSQAGGCGNDLGNQGVAVDDGASHACGMGAIDDTMPPPGYRMTLLPPSSVVPSLRACAYVGVYNPQCWNLKTPPAYNSILVSAGGTASGIDFCLTPCASPLTFYRDLDGDGHGTAGSSTLACAAPPGYVAVGDDCDDLNAQVWGTPGEARSLRFSNHQTLGWSAPVSLGGTSVVYDLLRTPNPADFVTVATCIESNDGPNTTAVDVSAPALRAVFYYLVRAENACPSGQGLLGSNSHNVPIPGRACP